MIQHHTFPKKLTGLKINDKMKEALDMRKYTKADDAESYTSGEGTTSHFGSS